MARLIVQGGRPLSGTVTPVPNKNSIIKLLPASLLTDDEVVISNVPQSTDVMILIQIMEKLGSKVSWLDDNTVSINNVGVSSFSIDPLLSDKMKASVMLLAPLLIRFGRAEMPTPQGCKLGTRPLDVLIEGMIQMGAQYEHTQGTYRLSHTGLKATEIWQWFPSVTGTENLILLAVRVPGQTIIYNAACEPHTQDLCHMLVAMGAKIEGIGSNRLVITGVDRLHGCKRKTIADHLDVGGYIAAAAVTGGSVTIRDAGTQHMGIIIQMMNKLGVHVDVDHHANTIHVPRNQSMVITKTVKGDIWRTHALHRPLLPPDFVHTCVVTALYADGQAIFDNLFYEYGFFFVQELAKMKANIILANPVTVITTGPNQFKGAHVMCPDILQAAYGLLIAALGARGESVLHSITPLFRRFPDFVSKFTSLGAAIELQE
ncbi:MAG: UDP-N-acetylglucosamine 1-carboxyvinyltransferase [Candidatus Absconditabacterales bacterium]|nr:UDP-N-acetylglucosamine 1-carboxyvinyltransferase [Candidatus Absconditabacterales bacterium]